VTTGRNTNETLESGVTLVTGICLTVENQRGWSLTLYFCAINDDSCGGIFLIEGLRHGLVDCRSTWPNVKVAKFKVHKIDPGNTNSVHS